MDKKYYTEYAALEKNHWWFKARANILCSLVKRFSKKMGSRNLKILNVGVATGQTTRMLEQFGTVTSLEFDEDCCHYLKNIADIDVIQGSVTNLPFQDDSYDLVCAFDVIEHVEDDKKAIEEISRVLIPSGSVMLTVPAYMFLWSEHDKINQHFRRYTSKNLKSLARARFNIRYSSYFNFILFPLISIARIYGKVTGFRKTKEKGARSDFDFYNNSGLLNKLFYSIFNLEKGIIGKMNIPFGVSIIYLGVKNSR